MNLRIRLLKEEERGETKPSLVVGLGTKSMGLMRPRPAVLEIERYKQDRERDEGEWVWEPVPIEVSFGAQVPPPEPEPPDLPLYDLRSRCPKCGCCGATTEYTGSDTIRRECKRCGASRYELPLDKGPRKLQPGYWARVHSPGDEYHGARCEVLAEEPPEKWGEEPRFRVRFAPFPGQPVAVYDADELHIEPTPPDETETYE